MKTGREDWFVQVAASVFTDIRPPQRVFPQRICSAKGFNPNVDKDYG